MQAVTKYQAKDGAIFDTEADALDRESLLAEMAALDALLVAIPKNDGCSFANGGGYIQQDVNAVREYKTRLLTIAGERLGNSNMKKWAQTPDEVHGRGIVGRLLSDSSGDPMYKAWYRIMCMDDLCREWGQPYYANNPHEAKQICLNGEK